VPPLAFYNNQQCEPLKFENIHASQKHSYTPSSFASKFPFIQYLVNQKDPQSAMPSVLLTKKIVFYPQPARLAIQLGHSQ
jgi:hypothetical protein